MSQRFALILVSLLLVLGAGVAVAVEGASEPSDPSEPADCTCADLAAGEEPVECDLPDDLDCEEPTEPSEPAEPVEEPEASEESDEGEDTGMPPFLGEDAEMEMPPGLAEREVLPYGLAKKLDPELLPPGQAKAENPDEWEPPGKAKKGDDWQPPGKAKRSGG